MRFVEYLYNAVQFIIEKIREYIYLFLPLVSLSIYLFLKDEIFLSISENLENYTNNIINLSGVLAGFLFTTFGTFMSLPNNKFLDALEDTGYFKSIYRLQLLGIISLFLAMLLGLFGISIKLTTLFFMIGISEAMGSLYYFYKILTLSKKSTTKY